MSLKARREALGLSQLEVDARAGFQEGYCAKIEIGTGASPSRRNLSKDSLFALLGALETDIVLKPRAVEVE